MAIRIILAVVAVFITWSVADFIIHGMILDSAYEATASLWRPMEEMKMSLVYFAVLVTSFVFVYIYARFFSEKGIMIAIIYGLLFGFNFKLVTTLPQRMAIPLFVISPPLKPNVPSPAT